MTSRAPSDEVWGVVTVHRPAEVPPLLADLAPQVTGIIVVDDGSGSEFDSIRAEIASSGAQVVALEHNSGIATALNRGIRGALDNGASAIVTFDQDSTIAPGFVDALRAAWERARTHRIAAGPVVPEFFADVSQAGSPTRHGVVYAAHAIQSGMYLPAEVVDRVGLMDDALFIDLVDTDFELRCLDADMPCIVAPGLRLPHRLGARYRIPGPLGALLPTLTLSTPFRYYYRARNRIVLARRHPRHRARLRRDARADYAYFLIAWMLATPRSTMRKLLVAGFRDGRAERMGRMGPALAADAARVTWRIRPLPDALPR
ncbi:glycosyltransferase [Microbacterium sp. K2]|uniref:glycosyltransferase n=1 Tax=Microbacterium sp. K2 TaxID=3391827 RepID=UPI003ED9C30C